MGNAFVLGGTIMIVLLVSGIIAFLFAFTKRNWKFKNEKERMQSQFSQALLQTQIEIQEQTLKNISQEIHDNIGQVLSLAKLNLNTLKLAPPEEKETKVLGTVELLTKAINDLRELSRSIHGDKIADLGFQNAVAKELKIINNTGQFKTDLQIGGQQYELNKQQSLVLFRIMQEALNNAVKHSQAKNLTVFLNYQPTIFQLKIADDGKGFDADKLEETETGIGLRNMSDRASLIGAKFSVHSVPGRGANIFIDLPMPR